MRKARILLQFVICIGVAILNLPPIQPSAAQESSAPYLYYQSTLQNTVIVERADGTDSHALGGVTMPDNHTVAIGPQFSIDHQWVAWTSRGDASGDTKLYVVRVDGTARVEHVENLNRVHRLLWSPINNYLAIVRTTRAGNSGGAEQEYEILLVDTQFGDIITKQTQVSKGIEDIAWSADGEVFSFYYSVRLGQDYTAPVEYKRLDMELDDDFSRTNVTPTACEKPNYAFPNSPVSATVALADRQLLLNGANGPTQIELPPGYFQSLQWSPDGQQMVVWMRDECTAAESDAAYHAWYYRMGNDGFQDITSSAMVDGYSGQALWSAKSQIVALAGRDGLIYLVTTTPEVATTTVPMPADFDPTYAAFQWMEDQTLYLQSGYTADTLYVLTPGATEFIEAPNLPDYPDKTSISADGRYMAFSGDCPAVGELIIGATCVVDMQSNTTAVIYPHSGSGLLGYDFKEIYWHPSTDWLLVVNGGGAGGGEQFAQVANADGSMRRELVSCGYAKCYGWLPDQVAVETIPPFEPLPSVPVMTLTGMQNFVTKAEWNPDGTKIAVSAMDGVTHVFDATTGQVLYTVTGHIFDWSPDGTALAAVDRQLIENGDDYIIMPNEGPIVIYDAVTGQRLSKIEGSYFNLDYSPDGQFLAVGSQLHNVSIIDVATGGVVYATEFVAAAAVVAFSPDGQRLAIGGVGNEVWVWDYAGTASPQVLTFDTELYFYGIFALDWRSDGTQLLGSGGPGMFFFGNTSAIFDLASGDITYVPDATYATFTTDGVYRAHVQEYNGRLQIVGTDDEQVALQLYVSGLWIDFNPAMSHILVAEPYAVTIWQLP